LLLESLIFVVWKQDPGVSLHLPVKPNQVDSWDLTLPVKFDCHFGRTPECFKPSGMRESLESQIMPNNHHILTG
jgi:hypothetical protein